MKGLLSLWPLFLAFLGFVLVIVLLIFGMFKLEEYKCRVKYDGYTTRYQYIGGCMIRTDKGWAPSKNLRVDGEDHT